MHWCSEDFGFVRCCGETSLELAIPFACYDDIVVGGFVCRAIGAISRAKKFEKCVSLAKRDELALAKLTDESLAAEL